MAAAVRADDHRSDEMLAEHGRFAARLGLAVGFTSGIVGAAAKAARGTGSGVWNKAAKILTDVEFAAGLFVEGCRTCNPIVVASCSNLVLLEIDGSLELLERFGIVLSETVCVRSARGWHFWYRPPPGKKPMKIQVSADGVDVSSDGYLVMPPALHPTGHVYSYERPPLWTP
jgi:hypothetical protein